MHWVMAASLRSVKNAVWHVAPCASPTKEFKLIIAEILCQTETSTSTETETKVTKQKTLALQDTD